MPRSRSRSHKHKKRSRSNSSNKINTLDKSLCHFLINHSTKFEKQILISEEIPKANPLLGDNSLMDNTKSKIDPYAE